MALSVFILASTTASAFVVPTNGVPLAFHSSETSVTKTNAKALSSRLSEELDLPCEDDCAVDRYPNLPESVHPGVLSGQAQVDLLTHAKENGEERHDAESMNFGWDDILIECS